MTLPRLTNRHYMVMARLVTVPRVAQADLARLAELVRAGMATQGVDSFDGAITALLTEPGGAELRAWLDRPAAPYAVGMTVRQRAAFDFIVRRFAQAGVAPSYREMEEGLGLPSKSAAHRLVHALKRRGIIDQKPGARGIRLLQQSLPQPVAP